MTHIDAAGNDLKVGDIVYYSAGKGKESRLHKKIIVELTPKMVKVDYIDLNKRDSRWDTSALRYPLGVVKADPPDSEYEYGIGDIWHDLEEEGPHREGMESAQEAHFWIEEFAEMCPPDNKIRESYYVIRRPKGKWERI